MAGLWVLGLHLDVAVGQAIEEQIGCEFFVFVAGEVGLSGFELAETQLPKSVDGLFVGGGNEDGSGRVGSLLGCGFSLLAFVVGLREDLLELVGVLRDQLSEWMVTL